MALQWTNMENGEVLSSIRSKINSFNNDTVQEVAMNTKGVAENTSDIVTLKSDMETKVDINGGTPMTGPLAINTESNNIVQLNNGLGESRVLMFYSASSGYLRIQIYDDTDHSTVKGYINLDNNGDFYANRGIRAGSGIETGRSSGSVALTTNDGAGNANVTFNHKDGIPDKGDGTNASSGRIEVETDVINGDMVFSLGTSSVEGDKLSLTDILKLYGDPSRGAYLYGDTLDRVSDNDCKITLQSYKAEDVVWWLSGTSDYSFRIGSTENGVETSFLNISKSGDISFENCNTLTYNGGAVWHSGNFTPYVVGEIRQFSGDSSDIPTGWYTADGANGTLDMSADFKTYDGVEVVFIQYVG